MTKSIPKLNQSSYKNEKIENYPEWNIETDLFKVFIGIIDNKIIFTRPSGILDEDTAFKILHIFLNLMERKNKVFADSRWISVHDWKELSWIHPDARKIIFEDYFFNPQMVASIFYNLPHHLDFQLKLGKELRKPPCQIEIVKNYEEAVLTASKILGVDDPDIIAIQNDLVSNTLEVQNGPLFPHIDPQFYSEKLSDFISNLKENSWIEEDHSHFLVPHHPLSPLDQIFSSIKMDIEFLRSALEKAQKEIDDQKIIIQESENFSNNLKGQIQQADKMVSLGKMTSGIVHELNNPLMIIKGLAENALVKIKKNKITAEDFENIITKINGSLSRIFEMNKDLKKYIHHNEETNSKINAHEALESLINFIKPSYQKDGINFNLFFNAVSSEIIGNSGKIQQVLMNYLSNSKDAMENSKEKNITISTSNKKNALIISVSDSGEGIEKSKEKEIFKTFYTSKAKGKGTGLGLSIVKTIVEEMNGQIVVDSQLGVGTTFHTIIPLAEKENSEIASENRPIKIDRKESFKGLYLYMGLFNTPIIKLIEKTLDDFGMIGDFAQSPQEIFEKNKAKNYDLFIINMGEEESNATSFLMEFLRTRGKDQSHLMVLIPNQKVETFNQKFIQWGANIDGIIRIPFTQQQILNFLKKIGLSHNESAQKTYPINGGDK